MVSKMNVYRTHFCSELSINNLGNTVTLSGWADTIRDHGNLLFIDLRDNYGITQCVVDGKHSIFNDINKLSNESVITINGKVVKRSDETVNKNLSTGQIEVQIEDYKLLSKSEILPLPVNSDIGLLSNELPKFLNGTERPSTLALLLLKNCNSANIFLIFSPLIKLFPI